jgi:hypothetical protein
LFKQTTYVFSIYVSIKAIGCDGLNNIVKVFRTETDMQNYMLFRQHISGENKSLKFIISRNMKM